MKKVIALVLALLMCFSLVGCDSRYEKYETLIGYIEAGDYESALGELIKISKEDDNDTDNDKKDEKKEPVAVHITSENWETYFKIEERYNNNKNAFGEIEDVYKAVYLVLKDEYEIMGYETHIAVEYNYVKEWHYVQKDKTAGTLTIGDPVPDRTSSDMKGSMVTITGKETCLTNSREYTDTAQAVPVNFEIVRMQGTLYIAE